MPTSLYPSLSWNHSGSSTSNLAMVAPQPQEHFAAGGERYDKGGKKKMSRHQGKRGTDNYGRELGMKKDDMHIGMRIRLCQLSQPYSTVKSNVCS